MNDAWIRNSIESIVSSVSVDTLCKNVQYESRVARDMSSLLSSISSAIINDQVSSICSDGPEKEVMVMYYTSFIHTHLVMNACVESYCVYVYI